MATIKSKNGCYKLVIPDGYTSSEDDDVLFIYDNDKGIGAISIHDYHLPDYTFIIEEELKDFMKSIDDSRDDSSIQVINDHGYSSGEFISSSGAYWKIWTFYKDNYAVFASYHCDSNDMHKEIKNVDIIMQSLKISDYPQPYFQ